MWVEPLTATTALVGGRTVFVTVSAGDGTAVARVLCAHGGPARCGIFGEMRLVDAGGAPRQTARAMALLVREALRYAASIGVTRVETEAPPRLREFAARMSGLQHTDGLFSGELDAVRSHHLQVTDADGNELADAPERAGGSPAAEG
jgi:hypothetical protein